MIEYSIVETNKTYYNKKINFSEFLHLVKELG